LQGTDEHINVTDPLPALFEDGDDPNSPPEAPLTRRAKSYSDFYDIVKTELSKGSRKKKRTKRRGNGTWDALALPASPADFPVEHNASDYVMSSDLLLASQQEYLLYQDQLAMTERHLGTLIDDANSALGVLQALCQSFRAVEDQTRSFQSQCDNLLSEKRRLEVLANEVGTDLHYYGYLDSVTRRLNAPGAARLVNDDSFEEILANLESCIAFMSKNVRRIYPLCPRRFHLTPNSHHTEMLNRIWHGTRL